MNHYERFLVRITDEVFDEAYRMGLTWIGLARKSGLCYSTVHSLGTRKTRFPQLRTIFLLAKAVRMNVQLLKKEIRRHASEVQEAHAA